MQNQLRWDQADLISYYFCTDDLLGPLLTRLDEALLLYDNGNLTPGDVAVIVDEVYYDIVSILVSCAKNFVPERRKAFYKFWWDAELTSLKEAAVDADKLWKKQLVSHVTAQYLTEDKLRECITVNASRSVCPSEII